MPQAVFIGEHELTIDEKNRLLVPSEVRKEMDPIEDGEGFFIVIGPNRKPWFYSDKYYKVLIASEAKTLSPKEILQPDKDAQAQNQKQFALASKVAWDKQGRVLVPDSTLRRTNTGREVTLIGVGDHLELWNRNDWELRFSQLLDGTN